MTASTMIQPNDVLFGRGGATNQHVGNKVFRGLVAQHMPVYLRARKKDKIDISYGIVSAIKRNGGRFLMKQTGTKDDVWVVVPDKRAREKTSQALREGLDVRHKKFRCQDVKQQDEESNSVGTLKNDEYNARTRPRVVTGVVVLDSSSSMSVNNDDSLRITTTTSSPPVGRRISTDLSLSMMNMVNDGTVPDLLDEDQFADATDDVQEEEQRHLNALMTQFVPPRTTSSSFYSMNHVATVPTTQV